MSHNVPLLGRTQHYYLEMACKIQVDILSCTDNPIEIPEDAMEALHEWGSPDAGPQGEMPWPALMRLLDRTQPDYKN